MRRIGLAIAVAFGLFILNIWMENASEGFYNEWIRPVLEKRIRLDILFVIGAMLYYIFDLIIQNKEAEISNLKSQITTYEEQLKEETKGLWRHFKDLNRFNRQEIVMDVMKTLVNNQEYVIAAQLYEYTIMESPNHTSIKVSHRDGYVAERERLNALLQEYYVIDHETYSRFKKACRTLPEDEKEMFEFIREKRLDIGNRSIEELTGNTQFSVVYSLLLLGIESFLLLYAKDKQLPIYSINVLNDQEKEKVLRDNKRTGILRGILNSELVNGDYYIFYHEGNNDKKGRIYFTKAIKIAGNKHIFLIALSTNIQRENDWITQIQRIGDTFVELLKESGLNVQHISKV
ncbi:hypothetical protein [Parageobacillus thermoglucosidasius]|uniref:hypothetical protein n=1 Tax=Parageobacillus thermoglucosidasius TaxID=1426 RepID=UPI000E1636B7|nr:hypothetical protein [Parageobacillus thermoglucosidasius]MED4904108.1 hypothetical protein [Parageobacillus thermoglucosidasius]MED4915658.1 hypothetical protein [Parageobacillus thermoglucosidasius]MED4945077.1 hypothetical protein [Parageobacillus thermoglucosidasius]MED4983726.1 hypothetical protein [Parageobacillus thermoglucosidasius]RDE19331.1 hypothetical protein DV714_20065 [Parageobacillus thermoglucosidasius]